jgi:hypothetical protein
MESFLQSSSTTIYSIIIQTDLSAAKEVKEKEDGKTGGVTWGLCDWVTWRLGDLGALRLGALAVR